MGALVKQAGEARQGQGCAVAGGSEMRKLSDTVVESFEWWKSATNERYQTGDLDDEQYQTLSGYIDKVLNAIEVGDAKDAAYYAVGFTTTIHKMGITTVALDLRSRNAQKAANSRHALSTPMPKVQLLKKEYARVHKLLAKKNGKEPRPTTVYKEISIRLWGVKKYWRRIRTQVEKDTTK
jgi:hypothetical protein